MIERIGVAMMMLVTAAVAEQRAAAQDDKAAVSLRQTRMTIPTYRLDAADRNPIFYHGRKYQGAKGPVYPYPMLDKLTDVREDTSYEAILLENKYVSFSILPEIGGRIFTGTDKTNNYEFFYRQHVIKPALIGMAGAWISGGVEWNIPHHHRASTYMPVDYRLVDNRDGSKTVWLGEMERRHRMKWLIGLTLYPDKSYLEVTIRLLNRTPLPHSMLYFANVAVHSNPDYQVLFPPSTEFGTQHAKRELVHWPIGQEVYADLDRRGVDLSWWKNHPKPISIFAWNYQDDFFGGYDHGNQAGVLQVADHNVAPGKKFFEWGSGDEGQMWDKVLTETDGPYLELMAGAYSDNQPDYSWVEPYEVRTVKQYWYPIRQLAGVKHANTEAAVNLEVKDAKLQVAFNTTSAHRQAKAIVRTGDRVLSERSADIGPDSPFVQEVALPAGVAKEDVRVSLLASTGRELISYQPKRPAASAMPKPVEPPSPPQEVKTNEQLYLTGLRLEQFHNPALEPDPYYEEALRRDPGDSRVNTALGILYCKRGRFQDAESRLKAAIERITWNYTRPKDGEAYYYLGVARQAQGRHAESDDAFQRAAWSHAWHSASHFRLAQNACRRGQWAQALKFANRSLSTNALNTQALDLKAVVLRKLGRTEQAIASANQALVLDPLDFWAAHELCLAKPQPESKKEQAAWTTVMHGEVQSYLELACDYGACGQWDEAIEVLSRFVDAAPDKTKVFPMVHYYLGYYCEQKGDADKAGQHYRLGGTMPTDYCFPFRSESIEVLRRVMARCPNDARAPYYLGNILYDIQPAAALAAWERSRSLDEKFATVHRNLATAYARLHRDYPKAVASQEKAVACDPHDARLYAELDHLYHLAGVDPQKRLALLEANHQTIAQRIDSHLREISLNVIVGRCDRALELLSTGHFRRWEGEFGAHDSYVDALLLRAEGHLKGRRYADALKDLDAALEYPERFEAGRPCNGGTRDAKVEYLRGLSFEGLGQADKAQAAFRQALTARQELAEARYYCGLTHRKLGDERQATACFDGLLKSGTAALNGPAPVDFFAKFGVEPPEAFRKAEAHYQIGLGLLGKGNCAEAKREFEQALRLDVDHFLARTKLAEL
jgi:tetratricopeptide (TPR) repeat protein